MVDELLSAWYDTPKPESFLSWFFFFAAWRVAVEAAFSLPLACVALLFKGVFFLMVFLGAILKEICVGMCGERFQEPAS